MKKLVMQKQEAEPLMEFLVTLELKNKVSRLRNKLNKKLATIVAELEEDRVELCKEYAEKDESGEAITENNQYKVEDMVGLNGAIQELYREEVAVEVGDYSSNFQPLFDYLDSDAFDMSLSGNTANCYDRLLDIWEVAMEQTEEGAN